MQDSYHRKIFKILGTFVLLLALFLGIPMLVYAMVYGFGAFQLFHMIGYSGPSLMMDLFVNMVPIIMYSTFGLILIGLLIISIFFQKKRAYKILLIISNLFCFFGLLFVVLKTFHYIPNFFVSVIVGIILAIGGFVSWVLSLGVKGRKLKSFIFPLIIWMTASLSSILLLMLFQDDLVGKTYLNEYGNIVTSFHAPWSLNINEYVFVLFFGFSLWISRFSILSIKSYQEISQNRKYNRKSFGLSVLAITIVLGVIAYLKKDFFVAPKYDISQYQNIFIKKGYQEHIATGDNIYYRQNQWLLDHTNFLDKTNQNPFVVQNYLSQTGIIQSGFADFWQEFSGDFRSEFSNIALISSGDYSMVPIDIPHYDAMGFPEERLRERTSIVNAVATQLCRLGQCQEGFAYRKDRFVFANKRLENGAGIFGSLVSIVTVQKSLSGTQEMLPYLSSQQKQELQSLLIPYDTGYLYHNMIVQEYYFVHQMGIESSKYFMQEQNISAPKFLLDLDYTEYLIKKHFVEALSRQQNEIIFDYENKRKFSYNILGNSILNALLPRVSHIYNRFEELENQRYNFYRKIYN